MAFFKNLFSPQPPPPKPVQYQPVPQQLPKIQAPTAAEIAKQSNPSPAAQEVLAANPQQTPPQYLNTLQEKQMGDEMVKTMAHGMPDREGVQWAAQSADKVSGQLPPQEVEASQAAQAWAKNPTPENKAAAAAAAAKGGCRGPGSLAAQGAAWSQPSAPAAPAAPGAPAAPRMTPYAVTGAVLMAAAIKANPAAAVPTLQAPTLEAPKLAAPTLQAPTVQAPTLTAPQAPAVVPPSIQTQTFQQQHPFIANGLDIASGKTTWA
jgi:hypothetical protein